MTAMDAQPVSSPPSNSVSNSVPPPVPPPPPGCPGSLGLPNWRSEPLPAHLAPTKEQIEKEQYAHLPDKLLNSMNKDKKPFTYTPSGVSGDEKGKLDLSSIRSPRMKKRLLANLADDENGDSEPERVTRSETPEVKNKPKPEPDIRRAMTPDMSYNRQMYAPVLPPIEMLKERPSVPKYKSEEELEAYVKKQMNEMENTLHTKKDQFSELAPEVQELINSYNNVQQKIVPIKVEERQQRPVEPEERQVVVLHEYTEPERANPIVEQTPSYKLDYNRNPINVKKDPNNDLLRHVLDGGLQEEIEKFEQISLETQQSSTNPKRNDFYEREMTPTFETFGRSLPNPSPVWSPYGSSNQDPYGSTNQTPSPYASLNRPNNRNGIQSPKPFQSPQPFQRQQQSIANARQFWSESPSPSPHPYYERETASVEPVYRGAHIPSNQQMRQNPGYIPSEVTNYNSRPKPFYLSGSPPPTPTPTPPPPAQFMPQQSTHRPRDQQFSTFGKNIAPQKFNYDPNDNPNSGYDQMPQTKYIENMGMFAQVTAPEDWNRPASPIHRPVDRNIKFSERIVTSPDRSGLKSPEPPKPILKKKLPPSERPPDRTPPKYMGGNIPSRSFRVLQLMTGEDIDNQFIDNTYKFETKIAPKSKVMPKTVNYSNYGDFGTDF